MLHRSRKILGAVILTAAASILGLAWLYLTPPNNSIELVFNAMVGDQPLEFNKFLYRNPGGDEKFRVRNFRFYVSNIKLYGKEGEYIEGDSYHLARFDNSTKSYTITLKDVRLSELTKIELSIGVDESANTSIKSIGDLDPNNLMAWNWKVGYKFVLLEGAIRIDGKLRPLVYHIGFSENRRDLVFSAAEGVKLNDGKKIQFTVDVMKLFVGVSNIDMATIQSVKFDKNDARLFADNYRKMINVNWQ